MVSQDGVFQLLFRVLVGLLACMFRDGSIQPTPWLFDGPLLSELNISDQGRTFWKGVIEKVKEIKQHVIASTIFKLALFVVS